MRFRKQFNLFSIILSLVASGYFLPSCTRGITQGEIILTQVRGKMGIKNFITGDLWRYIPESQIIAFDPKNPVKSIKVISGDFFSARSPEVSWDAKRLLFAGQKSENDPWQIWEMNLKDASIRQVTTTAENCIDPAYLPGGKIVFSKFTDNDTLKTTHSLCTVNLDGSGLNQISFTPDVYFASDILKDGRIVCIDRPVIPEKGDAILTVMRPDGTKAEMFYKSHERNVLLNRVRETPDGKVVFIESDPINQDKGNVISINYKRPLHSRVNLTNALKGTFLDVFPVDTTRLLVSYKPADSDHYSLYEFDRGKQVTSGMIYDNPDYDVVEAVVVQTYERPRKLPSEVDMGVKTGLLLCQDMNSRSNGSATEGTSVPKASRIEVIGIDSLLGTVHVETDGSFYLKVLADIPFRIQTIDDKGNVLNGPCDWIYLRPNERRGCAGCHEDQELAPDNRYCLSVSKPPHVIPVHKSKLNEKEIELE